MTDKKAIYPKGISVFPPHEKAPEFVKGTILITPNDLIQWLKDNPGYLKDYKGNKQLRLQLKTGTKGLYCEVDQYEGKKDDRDSLPF